MKTVLPWMLAIAMTTLTSCGQSTPSTQSVPSTESSPTQSAQSPPKSDVKLPDFLVGDASTFSNLPQISRDTYKGGEWFLAVDSGSIECGRFKSVEAIGASSIENIEFGINFMTTDGRKFSIDGIGRDYGLPGREEIWNTAKENADNVASTKFVKNLEAAGEVICQAQYPNEHPK